ncbi:MAG TPA: rod shape-determining protein MreD [Flavobacteriaceae bacterium]|nr:rod shape-determining protein MreD [Flavobacteriaceae bacterium]
MNSAVFLNIARFVLLVLLQGLVLCNINFLGYINPYLYVLFIILLPANLSPTKVIFYAFLLGLCIDFFQDSGGVHASACLVAAYLRPVMLQFSFGITFGHQTLKFKNTPFSERLQYVLLMVFVHHLILFSLEIFNAHHILLVLKKTLFSGIFTTLLIIFTMILFGKKTQ